MYVYGGILCNTECHDEMNLGIRQPDKDVVLAPRSIWYQPLSMWIIWFHIVLGELSSAFYRLKLDPVFSACNLFDGFQSAKFTTLCGGMGHQ